MNRQEALTRLRLRSHQAFCEYVENGNQENEEAALDVLAYDMAIAALNEPVSPTTQTDAQHAKKLTSNALAGTDYADRLRWLLSQAERVVTVDAEDRRAVERACKLLKDIDNGFDRVRV